eukprot:Rhum_TRINITY_DN16527_c0_g1::Rhum_TRINITY_DN16527_c0_g1_i1::g.163517::m.163517
MLRTLVLVGKDASAGVRGLLLRPPPHVELPIQLVQRPVQTLRLGGRQTPRHRRHGGDGFFRRPHAYEVRRGPPRVERIVHRDPCHVHAPLRAPLHNVAADAADELVSRVPVRRAVLREEAHREWRSVDDADAAVVTVLDEAVGDGVRRGQRPVEQVVAAGNLHHLRPLVLRGLTAQCVLHVGVQHGVQHGHVVAGKPHVPDVPLLLQRLQLVQRAVLHLAVRGRKVRVLHPHDVQVVQLHRLQRPKHALPRSLRRVVLLVHVPGAPEQLILHLLQVPPDLCARVERLAGQPAEGLPHRTLAEAVVSVDGRRVEEVDAERIRLLHRRHRKALVADVAVASRRGAEAHADPADVHVRPGHAARVLHRLHDTEPGHPVAAARHRRDRHAHLPAHLAPHPLAVQHLGDSGVLLELRQRRERRCLLRPARLETLRRVHDGTLRLRAHVVRQVQGVRHPDRGRRLAAGGARHRDGWAR